MINKLEQAARQALEALREYRDTQMISAPRRAIDSLLLALDEQTRQSQQNDASLEPVGVVNPNGNINWRVGQEQLPPRTKLYAAPLAKQDTHATHVVRTKDLTDEEIVSVLEYYDHEWDETTFAIARAVIAADRAKNI